MTASKQHFSASWKSLKLGTRFFLSALGALPGILGEKRARRMEKREGVRREKAIEKRKRCEFAFACCCCCWQLMQMVEETIVKEIEIKLLTFVCFQGRRR